MLDRALLVRGSDTHEHVTVNQQPHDAADAARLYGEIEAKAQAKVLDRVTARLEPTTIQATAYRVDYLAGDMAHRYFIAFHLNGQPHKVEITVAEWEKFRARDMAGIFESIILPKLTTALLSTLWNLPGAAPNVMETLKHER